MHQGQPVNGLVFCAILWYNMRACLDSRHSFVPLEVEKMSLFERRNYVKELRVKKNDGKDELSLEERKKIQGLFLEFLRGGFDGDIQISSVDVPRHWFYIKVKEEQVVFDPMYRSFQDALITQIKACVQGKAEVQLVTESFYGG